MFEGGLSSAEKAFLVWEIAAQITLQKYLSDINKALRRIEGSLDDIRSKMDEDITGKLSENYNSIKRMLVEIQTTPISTDEAIAYMVQLDHIERESAQIAAASLSECIRAKNCLEALKTSDKNWKEIEGEAISYVLAWTRAEFRVITGNMVGGTAAYVRSLLASNPNSLKERIRDRIAAINNLEGEHGAFGKLCKEWSNVIQGHTLWKTDPVYKDRFNYASQLYLRDTKLLCETTMDVFRNLELALKGDNIDDTATEVYLSIDESGTVIAAKQLPA